ncbi:MAG: NADH-quinone oxidoreductase subunit L [Alphaproteobacteria bacterium]|nr:NADH-quinone oxidoreductase subunit L [Alphaproteobacteria bacterium]
METVLVLAPLAAAAIAGLLQRYIGDKVAMSLTTAAVGLAAALSIYIFADLHWLGGEARTIPLFRFVDIAGFTSTWSVRIDALSSVMLVVVTSVSFLVHVYSWGYMAEDPHRARFFAYLSFFTFSMLALVTANDFLQLFFGWEGVGVASYLLIGFWYQKRSANDAAIKAFVVNRVGDFGFALGIMAAYYAYGSIEFDAVFKAAAANPGLIFQFGPVSGPAIEIICGLLFIGAMGKSAQFFLHVWLPDAMEGPTPVSALIHAATMVTAGVFMVCRCSSMFEMAPVVAGGVTLIGAVTAIFAATCGLAQNDIKRVIAYSTCSQLGYMFFAAGVGAYGAAMFHLFTHAFFKALLFLGAGSVIHGMHHEQDMRFMGGVRKAMPITWAMMLVGTLALIGFGLPLEQFKIGFAGFWSKDHIIESTFVAGESGRLFAQFAFVISLVAALLTSFYSWRLLFMTFEGRYRPNPDAHHDDHGAHGHDAKAHDDHGHDGHAAHDDHGHGKAHGHAPAPAGVAPAHESPWVMVAPLVVLAFGAVLAGAAFKDQFVGKKAAEFWGGTLALQNDPLAYPDKSHDAAKAAAPAEAHGPDAAHAAVATEPYAAAKPDEAHGAAAAHGEKGGHHDLPQWVIWAPFGVTLLGFLIALPIYFFSAGAGAAIAKATGPLHAFLFRKWYFDELYDAVFVKGARALGDVFWKVGDRRIIDGLGPNGVAAVARFSARQLRKVQSGYLYHYSFLMLAAAVAFGAYALWASGLVRIGQ